MKELLEKTLGDLSLAPIVTAIILFIVCVVVVRLLSELTGRLLNKGVQDAAIRKFLFTGAKTAMWIIAVIIVADSLGIHTTSFVALISVAGLALSLSMQNVLGNLFSGMTLLFTRPFKAGDLVQIAGNQGYVRSIGMFYTVIVTPDSQVVTIPNGDVTSTAIINFSTHGLRRIDTTFESGYNCATEDVKAAISDAISRDSRIASDPAPLIGIGAYKESSISYTVRVFCDPDDYWEVLFKLNENVRDCFAEHGVIMTYNHLNVHIAKD